MSFFGLELRSYSKEIRVMSRIILIRVALYLQKKYFTSFLFNSGNSFHRMQSEICETFGYKPETCKLYDFFKERLDKRLDLDTYYDTPLVTFRFAFKNLLVLETMNTEGKFEIVVSKYRSPLESKKLLLKTNVFKTVLLSESMSGKALTWLRRAMTLMKTTRFSLYQKEDMIKLHDNNYCFHNLCVLVDIRRVKVVDNFGALWLVHSMVKRKVHLEKLNVRVNTNYFSDTTVLKYLLAVIEKIKCFKRKINIHGSNSLAKYFRKILLVSDKFTSKIKDGSELTIDI